jgi:hypothetical protein
VSRPRGVVGVISPWNLPLLLMTWKVGPALACGNTVVVKPSEETPSTATLLGEVMNTVGIPPGVYNVVNGFGPNSAGEFLTQHRGVDAFTFTGETSTGTAIMKVAADGVRPVSFELGGKNAALVFADCDFDAAVEGTARSSFAAARQQPPHPGEGVNVGRTAGVTRIVRWNRKPVPDAFGARAAPRSIHARSGVDARGDAGSRPKRHRQMDSPPRLRAHHYRAGGPVTPRRTLY